MTQALWVYGLGGREKVLVGLSVQVSSRLYNRQEKGATKQSMQTQLSINFPHLLLAFSA